MTFEQWLKNNTKDYDYCIVDPPWNYDTQQNLTVDEQITTDMWNNVKLIDLFQQIDTNYLFLWTTVSMLPILFTCYQESDYDFKTLIPWVKTNVTTAQSTDGNSIMKSSVEYLAIFQKPCASIMRFTDRQVIFEEITNWSTKPKKWESELIHKMEDKELSGVYVFSGGALNFMDCKESVATPQNNKVELF